MKWRLNLPSGLFVLKSYKRKILGLFFYLFPTPKSEHRCLLCVIWMNPGMHVQRVDFIPRGISVLICLCLRCYIFSMVSCLISSMRRSQFSFLFFFLNSRVLQRGGDGLTQPRCGESPLENLCPLFTLHSSTPSTGVKLSPASVCSLACRLCADSSVVDLPCRTLPQWHHCIIALKEIRPFIVLNNWSALQLCELQPCY